MTQISILGCGWLGLPLAKALRQNGFSVKGSTTSPEKLFTLEKSGIQPFLIALEGDRISGNIETFLQGSKILIIDIPPNLRGISKDPSAALKMTFVKKIENLIPFIEKSSIENVLFISSTSVYGDTNSIVTEATVPQPETESGKQLVATERLLQSKSSFKTTILRFGGLIGEDRHPVRFLAGKKNLDHPNAPVNLIHQKDCIGIILEILRQAQNNKLVWGETFNGVTPFHPSRKEYYTQKAIEKNLDLPEFNTETVSVGKTILNERIKTILNYTFTEPNL